jgi:predicted HTH transcriptional regulator
MSGADVGSVHPNESSQRSHLVVKVAVRKISCLSPGGSPADVPTSESVIDYQSLDRNSVISSTLARCCEIV